MYYKLISGTGSYQDKTTKERKTLLLAEKVYLPKGATEWDIFETLTEAMTFYNIESIPNEKIMSTKIILGTTKENLEVITQYSFSSQFTSKELIETIEMSLRQHIETDLQTLLLEIRKCVN
jgi:hypothetical protein